MHLIFVAWPFLSHCHLGEVKCKTSGLLSVDCAKKSWEEVLAARNASKKWQVEAQNEFVITGQGTERELFCLAKGVMDPQDHSMVIRLPHIIRSWSKQLVSS